MRAKAQKLAASVQSFDAQAFATYGKSIQDPMRIPEDMQLRLRNLTSEADSIASQLREIEAGLSEHVHLEIKAVLTRSAHQRAISFCLFALTLVVASSMVNLTIRRSVLQPLLAANTQLTIAKEQAAAGSRAKSEFLANMSQPMRS